jgi:glycosyltransferase involved in cell wall biosynthesis
LKKIYFIVTPFDKNRFSGGSIAVMKYISGLKNLGWDISIIPIAPSVESGWFDKYDTFTFIQTKVNKKILIKSLILTIQSLIRYFIFRKYKIKSQLKKQLTHTFEIILTFFYNYIPNSSRRSVWAFFLKNINFTDTLIISTTYETTYALESLSIKNYYWFMMHDERLFFQDFENVPILNMDAKATYDNVSKVITNSSWLLNKLNNEFPNKKYFLCLNALEDEFIVPNNINRKRSESSFNIISYAGRGAKWKGFDDMYNGFAMAVKKRPEINFKWRVYGMENNSDNIIEENPNITRLGFISNNDLKNEYINSDVMLSSSYYESFPLFPLEAMGMGTAVISTIFGCEDYLAHKINGYVIQPKSPEDICDALIYLAENDLMRKQLITNGYQTVKKYNWNNSVNNLNKILSNNKL